MDLFAPQHLILIFFVLGFPFVALIDILTSDFKESVNKIAWLLAVIFIPIVGPLLYLIIGRSQKKRNSNN